MILISFLTATSLTAKKKTDSKSNQKALKKLESIARDTKNNNHLHEENIPEKKEKKSYKILSEEKGRAGEVT